MRISERKWRKSRHVDDYMLFCAKRSNYMKIPRKAKVDHFNFIIKENENDQRQLFKVAKGLCRSFKESLLPEHDSKEKLAKNFGQFFVEKIDKIRDNFGTSKGFDKYYTRDFVIPKLSHFIPVSVEEIQKKLF